MCHLTSFIHYLIESVVIATLITCGNSGVVTGMPKTVGLPSSVRPSSSADTISVGSSHSQLSLDDRLPYAPGRPHVNSVLHLFGQWLVEAALAGVRVHGKVEKGNRVWRSCVELVTYCRCSSNNFHFNMCNNFFYYVQ